MIIYLKEKENVIKNILKYKKLQESIVIHVINLKINEKHKKLALSYYFKILSFIKLLNSLIKGSFI